MEIEKKKNDKEKNWLSSIVGIVLMLGMSMGAGYMMGKRIDLERGFGEFLFSISIILLLFYLAFFLQLAAHEGGHLLFGLLSGYRFCSFRIGSFMWIRKDGKIVVKRFSLAGTGGQCLMTPPDLVNETMPCFLYNMGGVFVNAILSLISLCGILWGEGIPYLKEFCICMILVGVFTVLMNGIPMKVNYIANDGYNALNLSKSPEAVRSLWIQMKVNSLIAQGTRLKDMPQEWFEIPSNESMQNEQVTGLAVLACNRLMDECRLAEAKTLIEDILQRDIRMIGIYRLLLTEDLICCELLGDCEMEKTEKRRDKDLEKFEKSMKKFPSVLRTQYAYALLADRDEAKAQMILTKFEQMARRYPYETDIVSERELLKLIDTKKSSL